MEQPAEAFRHQALTPAQISNGKEQLRIFLLVKSCLFLHGSLVAYKPIFNIQIKIFLI